MDTKALRQKILDLAIRGKLVPQDPTDEPASVLLERIRAEKQQMVKDGKLKPKDIKNDTVIFKGDDNLHYEKFQDGTVKCIEDEIPFELPEGWEWSRISTICIINPRNNLPEDTEVSFIPMPLIDDGFSNKHSFETRRWKDVKTGFTHFKNGDVGIAKITPCFENRKSVVFRNLINGCGAGTTELHILRPIADSLVPEYLLWISKMDEFISGGVQTFSGAVGQQRVGKEYVSHFLIPVPPTQEQYRLLNKLDIAFAKVEKVESSKIDLKDAISKTKSKILDLAIRGKLVPQDPDDEPASVLLERIRAEKEELIKQGKIKRDKKESVIFKGDDNSYYERIGDIVNNIDDEIPFELPQNWEWSRLQTICYPITDGTHKTPTYSDSGYIFLSAKNITTGKINWNDVMYIPKSLHDELYSRVSPKLNDILLAKNGTTGVAAIVDRECEFDIYVTLALLRVVNNNISSQYLLKIIASTTIQDYFKSSLKGIGVPNLHLEHIRTTLIPIPPANEQKEIAEKISQYYSLLDSIDQNVE